MKIFLYNHPITNSSFGLEGLLDMTKNLKTTIFHLWFPVIMVGVYFYKMVKKQTSNFSNFPIFHIFMHLSILSFFSLLVLYVINPVYHPMMILILLLNLFTVYHTFLTYSTIFIQLLRFKGYCSVILTTVILMFLRTATLNSVIVMTEEKNVLEIDFLESLVFFINIFLVIFSVVRWKIAISKFKNPDINGKSVSMMVNSAVTLGVLLIFHVSTFLKFSATSKTSYASNKLILNIYYLPFLWILSTFITNFPPVKNFAKKYDIKEDTEVPELQMNQISVIENMGLETTVTQEVGLEEINISV